jgi:CheY-like chemotaxis protein
LNNSNLKEPHPDRFNLLLIDDEPILLEAIQEILESKYFVTTSTDANEALARIEKGESFDCIICDLMMPRMDGMQFFDQIRKLSPAHQDRIIFMTGGSFTEKADVFIKKPGIVICEKPMKIKDLEKMIWTIVDTERSKETARAS